MDTPYDTLMDTPPVVVVLDTCVNQQSRRPWRCVVIHTVRAHCCCCSLAQRLNAKHTARTDQRYTHTHAHTNCQKVVSSTKEGFCAVFFLRTCVCTCAVIQSFLSPSTGLHIHPAVDCHDAYRSDIDATCSLQPSLIGRTGRTCRPPRGSS